MMFREEWDLRAEQQHGLKKLQMRAASKNKIAMARIEQAVRDYLTVGPREKIDFSEVDWDKVLPLLLDMLPAQLKILGIVI